MISFNKVLISTILALTSLEVESKPIDSSCLSPSERTIGQAITSNYFTNVPQIVEANAGSGSRMQIVETCTGSDGNLTGIQFTLATALQDPMTEGLVLDPIGQMNGDCIKLVLAGPLERIRVTQSADKGVQSISYFRSGRKKTFGKIGDRIVEWTPSDAQPIIGMHGSFSGDRISSIGFISLNTACQVPFDQTPDVVTQEDQKDILDISEPVDVSQSQLIPDEVTVIETEYQKELAESLEKEDTGYSVAAKVFVLVGILVFLSTCIFTLCRAKQTVKGEQRLSIPRAIELTTAPSPKPATVVDPEAQVEMRNECTTFAGQKYTVNSEIRQTGQHQDTVGPEDIQISSVNNEIARSGNSPCPSTPDFEKPTSQTLPIQSSKRIMTSCSSIQDEEDDKNRPQ